MICLRERGVEDGLSELQFLSEGSPDLVGVTEGIDATSAATDLFRDSTGRTSSSIIDEGDWLMGQITLSDNSSAKILEQISLIRVEYQESFRQSQATHEHEEFDRC